MPVLHACPRLRPNEGQARAQGSDMCVQGLIRCRSCPVLAGDVDTGGARIGAFQTRPILPLLPYVVDPAR